MLRHSSAILIFFVIVFMACCMWTSVTNKSFYCLSAKRKGKKKKDNLKDAAKDYQFPPVVLLLQCQIYLAEGLTMVIWFVEFTWSCMLILVYMTLMSGFWGIVKVIFLLWISRYCSLCLYLWSMGAGAARDTAIRQIKKIWGFGCGGIRQSAKFIDICDICNKIRKPRVAFQLNQIVKYISWSSSLIKK